MSPAKGTWVRGLIVLAVVVGLPLAGHWARSHRDPGCALDGTRVAPEYRVEVVDAGGRAHVFCCPICARTWLRRQGEPPCSVTVTDEVSGRPVDAAAAWYVRSSVVTVPLTGNSIHAFRDRADAERHAAERNGTVLPESERPLP
jgi:hypothetical protein